MHLSGTKEHQSLAERMAYYNIPGVSIAVIHDGKIDWAKGYGVIEAGAQKPVTTFTAFEAASISKPITVLTTMVQAQKGAIDLDAPIDRYLKTWHVPANAFSTATSPTARQIMCHHGGFNVEFVSGYTKSEKLPTLLEVLNGSPPSSTPAVKIIDTPGKHFRYSAGGFLVLQQALMDISQSQFYLLADQLFRPLAMHTSGFIGPSLTRPTPGVAKGHGFDGAPTARRSYYPVMSPAGLWTTPTDLCLAIIELQDALHGHGKLLKKETAQQLLTAQDEKPSIGLGFFLAGKDAARRFSMDGWNYGSTCRMVGFTKKGDGAVVMTNGDNGALMFEVLDAIGKTYNWPVQPMGRKEALPILPQLTQKFAGHYKWDETEQAEIIAKGSRMFLHVFHNDKNVMDPFPPAELFAKTDSEYFSIFPQITFRFDSDKTDQVLALIYNMEEKDVRAARIP